MRRPSNPSNTPFEKFFIPLTAALLTPVVACDLDEGDGTVDELEVPREGVEASPEVLELISPERQKALANQREVEANPRPPGAELGDMGELVQGDDGTDPAVRAVNVTHDTRPLLVIMLAKNASSPLALTEAQYRQKFFGPTDPNMNGYFDASSKGRFKYVEADIVSVVDRNDAAFLARAGATGASGTYATRLRSLMLADDAGFPFEDYDENGDGQVTTDELAVLTIDNYSEGAGQTGGTACVPHPGGVNVCTSVSLAGHRASLMTYAHELSHQFGTIDVYGASCHSTWYTLMGCTPGAGTNMATTNLDPWHRERLGWTASGTWAAGSGSVSLSPVASITGPFTAPGQERLIVTRPGTYEQLIFEHRRRIGPYDADVAREGLVVWYVNSDGAGNTKIIPSLTDEDGFDMSLFALSPEACIGDPSNPDSRGRSTRGYAEGSTYRFRWADGTDVGKTFVVGTRQANGTLPISWTTSSTAPSCPEAAAAPDLDVTDLRAGGCTGSGGDPVVRVEVTNHGGYDARGWVDVFAGLPNPPTIGTYSDNYRMTPMLGAGESTTMSFAVDRSHQGTSAWIDVLLDTTQSLAESDETNNHEDEFLALPDCSFN